MGSSGSRRLHRHSWVTLARFAGGSAPATAAGLGAGAARPRPSAGAAGAASSARSCWRVSTGRPAISSGGVPPLAAVAAAASAGWLVGPAAVRRGAGTRLQHVDLRSAGSAAAWAVHNANIPVTTSRTILSAPQRRPLAAASATYGQRHAQLGADLARQDQRRRAPTTRARARLQLPAPPGCLGLLGEVAAGRRRRPRRRRRAHRPPRAAARALEPPKAIPGAGPQAALV